MTTTLLEEWRRTLLLGQEVAARWLSTRDASDVDALRQAIRDEYRAYSESERIHLGIPSDPGQIMTLGLMFGKAREPVLCRLREVEQRAVSELRLIDAIRGHA